MGVTRTTQNELNRRASALAALAKHPSWPELEAEVERKIARLKRTAANVALADGGADQRDLDRIRGTIAALHWFVGVPKKADSTLKQFLREQLNEMPDEEDWDE